MFKKTSQYLLAFSALNLMFSTSQNVKNGHGVHARVAEKENSYGQSKFFGHLALLYSSNIYAADSPKYVCTGRGN